MVVNIEPQDVLRDAVTEQLKTSFKDLSECLKLPPDTSLNTAPAEIIEINHAVANGLACIKSLVRGGKITAEDLKSDTALAAKVLLGVNSTQSYIASEVDRGDTQTVAKALALAIKLVRGVRGAIPADVLASFQTAQKRVRVVKHVSS
ncbi:uncharacterized protein AB675_7882 [Cyphellophora attinorum]|uniref:Uncharacterized protein n=1 Tax=Cyphellophora attinorum TaxID=1664694 RepID=A0A0N1HAR5_9EURO|nr:uncharacterized protein AB675_7882 [Phialophora attinorum]KPI41163.1 hypothetical protein AB675_7882 [Phialophora attinorum]